MFFKKKKAPTIIRENALDWTNVTLGQYIELQDLILSTDIDKEDIVLREIQVLYGCDPYALDINTFKKYVESLNFMTKPMPKMKLKEQYNLGGTTYFLHKKLEQFKVAQYIDYQQIIKNNNGIGSYPEFLSLFLTPGENVSYGDGYDVAKAVEDIRNYMSIAEADSIAAFFLGSSKIYTSLSLLYSFWKTKKLVKDKKKRKILRNKTMNLIEMILGE